MKIILDFDDTLFDSGRFKKRAASDGRADLLMTPEIWEYYTARDFFYPDTLTFLNTHDKSDMLILTAMTPIPDERACDYQREKMRNAHMEEYVQSVTLILGDKGPHVEKMSDGEPVVFVDDRAEHLESALLHCSDVITVQILREEILDIRPKTTNPNVCVISTLEELDASIKKT